MIMRAALRVLSNGYDYLVLYLGLVWLGVLCLAWTPIAIIVYPLLSERRGRSLGRYVIMAVFRVYIASLSASHRFSFDLEALDVLEDRLGRLARLQLSRQIKIQCAELGLQCHGRSCCGRKCCGRRTRR